MTVKCPACGVRPRPVGKAMCLPCWRRVPEPLQRALYRAWRLWSARLGDAERLHNYSAALQACVVEAQR